MRVFTCFIAVLFGAVGTAVIYLVQYAGGWPIVATSAGSTLAALAYMGGPRPIAYTPYGELTVFVFFGLVAVCGAYYVQAGTIDLAAFLAATAIIHPGLKLRLP